MNASARAIRKRPASTPWWAWLAGALAVAGAIGVGLYMASTGKQAVTQLAGQSPATPAASTTTPSAPIQHPIEKALAGTDDGTPLPALDASDAAVLAALATLAGGGLSDILNPEHVIQRIVATIDALPRQKIAADALPVRGAQGAFIARQNGAGREMDTRNAARYAAYARVAQAIDAKALVAWYVHNYALFQEAYRELGYPDGYFNDRLIAVIDHLLQAPEANGPLALTQPNVMYEYADPALESRSAGQKLLLRSGPENEAAIKAKLREIRAALTGETLPR
jgi:hypothetical protein